MFDCHCYPNDPWRCCFPLCKEGHLSEDEWIREDQMRKDAEDGYEKESDG